MKKIIITISFILLMAVSFQNVHAGRIVVCNDEWTLHNTAYTKSRSTEVFAQNIASWFSGGKSGNFLVYSQIPALTGRYLSNTMIQAGHSWRIDTNVVFSAENLAQYDGVFLAGKVANNNVLIDYVNNGGNVYLAGGVGFARQWNTFLNNFGLEFKAAYNKIGPITIRIESEHPIFDNVISLYQWNGNSIVTTGTDDYAEILVTYNEQGLYAVYDSGIQAQPLEFTSDAGENISIYSEDETIRINGTVKYDGYNPLEYRWLLEEDVLLDWTPVGENKECPLVFDNPFVSMDDFILTIEVTDGEYKSSDTMVLTVLNSAPYAEVLEGAGTYQNGSEVVLRSEASDFDGDLLTFSWKEGSDVLFSGSIQAVEGGTPIKLPNFLVSNLDIGVHDLILEISDEINDTASIEISIEIVDTQVPTLSPDSSTDILWPPNHKMVDITVHANASDNSKLPVTLSCSILSSEPVDGLGNGDPSPDWTEPEIDQDIGIITFQLRAERSGAGNGREYSIMVTAMDESGNSSSAEKIIIVPHHKKKKRVCDRTGKTKYASHDKKKKRICDRTGKTKYASHDKKKKRGCDRTGKTKFSKYSSKHKK